MRISTAVMMRSRISIFALTLVSALIFPLAAGAQDDGPSLGELARNLRKNKAQQQPAAQAPAPALTVIDNDNLQEAMEEAKRARPVIENKATLSIDAAGGRLRVTSPDVMCSLSFNGRANSLLIKPVLIEDLPLDELMKLDGPGSIQENSLQLEVFNGTEWDLREITIGLTVERRPGENAERAARARVIPAADGVAASPILERRSDVTLLYHLKTQTKPFSTAAFHENVGITPGPDEDWRWSIVEAKGIRPADQPAPESLSEPLFGDPLPFVPSTNEPAPAQVPLAPQSVPGVQSPDGNTKQRTVTDNGSARSGTQR
jgi:hypothetical protein